MGKTRRIHFKDLGQDFLWWDLDENNKVVDCGPFQATLWVGTQVFDDSETGIIEGDHILFESKHAADFIRLRYPIEIIEDWKEVPHA
jgi:hypothetical protein